MIDLNQRVHAPELENLVDNCQNTTGTGKELPKLDVGTPVLYEKIWIVPKLNVPSGLRVPLKTEKIRKYHILADDSDRVVIRFRCHIKAYLTRSGRASKAPKQLIEQ